jgi:prepilin signal peptidase PulO-like enzyme (type II secretory pathway)
MWNALFALLGLVVGALINALADALPAQRPLRPPCCPDCGYRYRPIHWSAVLRRLAGQRQCPQCGRPERIRPVLVEAGTLLLFALLPSLIPNAVNLAVNTLYIAILVLVTVIDLEHRLILNVVTFPALALALAGSLLVTGEENSFWLAVIGAAAGFILFYIAYWIGQLLFGPGALGYGDVKLALVLGAMLGFHRILFALILAILLGGVVSLLLLLSRRFSRDAYLPYGQYLALAGIVMLIWGTQVVEWYVR